MRTTRQNLLIICEGQKTEPLFFNSIVDKIKAGAYNNDDLWIEIRPEPEVEEEITPEPVTHRKARKERRTKSVACLNSNPIGQIDN